MLVHLPVAFKFVHFVGIYNLVDLIHLLVVFEHTVLFLNERLFMADELFICLEASSWNQSIKKVCRINCSWTFAQKISVLRVCLEHIESLHLSSINFIPYHPLNVKPLYDALNIYHILLLLYMLAFSKIHTSAENTLLSTIVSRVIVLSWLTKMLKYSYKVLFYYKDDDIIFI